MKLNNVAFINYTASGGGAGRICSLLHRAIPGSYIYNKFEHDEKKRIISIEDLKYRNFFYRFCCNILTFLYLNKIKLLPRIFHFCKQVLTEPIRFLRNVLGHEDFNYPSTKYSWRFLLNQPSIVHCHNLFPDFFDFRSLISISKEYPTLITAHDFWLSTGHCAHPVDCLGYRTGCGDCPDLSAVPAINRDSTKYNLKRKKNILKSSELYLATPCNWLKKQFESSTVGTSFKEIRVIPNGVEIGVFKPLKDKPSIREKYNLQSSDLVFTFVAHGVINNQWKKYGFMLDTLRVLSKVFLDRKIIFICVGEEHTSLYDKNFENRFIKHVNDRKLMNEIYNCSDFYFHLAKADTFPNTILEAQAAGIPVITNPVCGIREQIIENKTGWFVSDNTPEETSEQINEIVKGIDNRNFTDKCRKHIINNFLKISELGFF